MSINNPSQIANLQARWARGLGQTLSGGLLSAWADQTGNAWAASQATAGNRMAVIPFQQNQLSFATNNAGSTPAQWLTTGGTFPINMGNMTVYGVIETPLIYPFSDHAPALLSIHPTYCNLAYNPTTGRLNLRGDQITGNEFPLLIPNTRTAFILSSFSNPGSGVPSYCNEYVNGAKRLGALAAVGGDNPITQQVSIGSYNPGGFNCWAGGIDEIGYYSRAINDAEATDLMAWLISNYAINLAPSVNVVWESDSFGGISGAGNGTDHYSMISRMVPLAYESRLYNFSRGTRHLASLDTTTLIESGQTYPSPLTAYDASVPWNIYYIQEGTNDVFTNSLTGTQTFNQLKLVLATAKAAGFKTVVGTMVHRGAASGASAYNGECDTFNGLIMADRSGLIDAVAAHHLIPQLQNPDDTTMYFTDSIHPAWQGRTLMAAEVNRAFQRVMSGVGGFRVGGVRGAQFRANH